MTFGWTARILRNIFATPRDLSNSIHSMNLMLLSSRWLKLLEQTAKSFFLPLSCLSKWTRRLFEGLFPGHSVSTRDTDTGTMCFTESGGWHPKRWGNTMSPFPKPSWVGPTFCKFVTELTTGAAELLYQIWQKGRIFCLKSIVISILV